MAALAPISVEAGSRNLGCLGSAMKDTVRFFRADVHGQENSTLVKTIKYVTAFFITLALTASLIGIPLLFWAIKEVTIQRAEEKHIKFAARVQGQLDQKYQSTINEKTQTILTQARTLADKEAEVAGLKTQIEQLFGQLNIIDDQFTAQKTELTRLQTKIASAEAPAGALLPAEQETVVADLRKQILALQQELEKTTAGKASAEEALNVLKSQVAVFESQLAEFKTSNKTEIDQLNASLEQNKKALEANQATISQLTADLEKTNSLKVELEQARQAQATQEGQVAEQKGATEAPASLRALAQTKEALKNCEDRIVALESQIVKLTADLEKAPKEDALNALRTELAEVNSEKTALEVRITGLKTEVTSNKEENDRLQKALNQAKADFTAEHAQYIGLQTQIFILQQKIDNAPKEKDLIDLKAELEEIKMAKAALESRIASQTPSIAPSNTEDLIKAQEELAALRKELEQFKGMKPQEIADQLSKQKDEIERQGKAIQKQSEMIVNARKDLTEKNTEIEKLRKQLSEKDAKIQALKSSGVDEEEDPDLAAVIDRLGIGSEAVGEELRNEYN